ncbi:MAG: hypothetical protein RL009_1124 [Actinomycetota bacterium]
MRQGEPTGRFVFRSAEQSKRGCGRNQHDRHRKQWHPTSRFICRDDVERVFEERERVFVI